MRTITLADAKEKIVAAHARPALCAGGIAITPVPGHPELVVINDAGTAALVEVRGRLLHDILDAACAADVWSDIEGVVDSD
jgi:hypothetical protein